MKSQAEAVEILQTMVRTAHMKSIKGGGTLMTARLDEDITVKLCLWDVGCEECEAGEDFGDGSELASHESEQ